MTDRERQRERGRERDTQRERQQKHNERCAERERCTFRYYSEKDTSTENTARKEREYVVYVCVYDIVYTNAYSLVMRVTRCIDRMGCVGMCNGV